MVQTLHKGYLATKNKQSTMAFKGKGSEDLLTLDQARKLSEYAGVLADDVILIDVDDHRQSEILMDIVEDLQLNCRVYETTRGKHFLFMNNGVDKCQTRTMLAVGLRADIKLGSKNSYSVLKYNDVERPIIYDIEDDEEYGTVPKWLTPVKVDMGFIDMKSGDGRNQALFNYILTLQASGFSVDEVRQCIHLINDYVLSEPLSEREIETILRDDAFSKPIFYNGKTFLFDRFARYIISQHHVIKINGQLHVYDEGVYIDGQKLIERRMIDHIPDLNQAKRKEVLSYIDLLADDMRPSSAEYIAFGNGLYDLSCDALIPYSPDIIVTNRIAHDYEPTAYSGIVDNMLDKLAVGDESIRMLLEEVIGYCFYRRNELRKSFILIGDKSNGKSTYLDMIKTLLGESNTSALDLKELGDRFKTAELFGKLANIGDDIGDEFVHDPSVFKKVVSGDRVNAERKGCDPFDFNSYAKMLFSANNIPRIKDKSGAVLDRLVIVPFNAVFSKNDADFDPYIKYKLRSEDCMSYLINLGITGLKRVLANRGFTISDKVEREIKEYEQTNNPILQFFEELELDDIINQSTKQVFKRYSEFCLANNFTPLSNIEFSKQVKKNYPVEIVSKRIKGVVNRVFVLRGVERWD
jgi:putative DNA primase/helicase